VLNSMGESCYEGVRLLAALIQRAGGLDVPGLCSVADTVGYGGPRGEVHLQKCHLDQRIYLARADDLQFDVITSFRRAQQDER
jgi:urea transport system substrate-binding protein